MKAHQAGCEGHKVSSPTQCQDVAGAPTKGAAHYPKPVLESVRNFSILPDSARLAPAAVSLLRGHSLATYWRRVAAGEYPKPTRQFGRAVYNTVGEIRKIEGK